MRVFVSTIPFSGITLEATLPLAAINGRLAEGVSFRDIAFISEPQGSITLTRTHGGILAKGSVSGNIRQNCSTCADPVEHLVEADFDWVLQTASDAAAAGDTIEDPGVIFYEGEHVDLEEPIQEALILQISPFWHPTRDNDERCTYCSRPCGTVTWSSGSSEKTQSLGNLLQGALAGKVRR
jgi:uncharacterized metal-binding protein YceD (DUF177 family)